MYTKLVYVRIKKREKKPGITKNKEKSQKNQKKTNKDTR